MPRLIWRAARWKADLSRPLETGAGAIVKRGGWYVACTGEGVTGLGEVAPWPIWGTEASEAAATVLRGWPAAGLGPNVVADVAGVLRGLGLDPFATPALWAGCELAALDWLARRNERPLAALLADYWRDLTGLGDGAAGLPLAVPIAALIGADDPADAARAAARAVAAGHTAVKVKVGDGTADDDVARAMAAREAMGPDAELRLDANGAWADAAAAAPILARLAAANPVYVEQPVPPKDLAGLALLSAGPVKVAADEALGSPAAADQLLRGGVRMLVVKPMLLGGLLRAMALAKRAQEFGGQVVWSSALDRGVGTAGVLHLAAACPGHQPAGLGTAAWWADGGAMAGLAPEGGAIPLPQGPGLGMSGQDPFLLAFMGPALGPAPSARAGADG